MSCEVPDLCRRLLAGLVDAPWGQVSPSVYETGRLVSLAPGLAGQLSRVDYLVRWSRRVARRPDPAAAEGYGLVPVLSATEAMLTELRRGTGTPGVLPAARYGLAALFRWLRGGIRLPVPDTPAIELIVPALVAAVNQHLDELAADPVAGLDPWLAGGRLPLPAGMDAAPLSALRAAVLAGVPVPAKALHSLEVLGCDAAGAHGAVPVAPGTVGASPAATAAWLAGAPDPRGYLDAVAAQHGGPVPSVIPVTAFERAWVLAEFAAAGVDVPVPGSLTRELAAGIGPAGTPGGAGLPADADTTSVALVAVHHAGLPTDPSCLLPYYTGTHFCAWPGERTASASVNAHVLEALLALGSRPPAALGDWLAGQQREDGSWQDKWHASPYYATTCCARALSRLGPQPSTVEPSTVERAVEFVLSTQHSDGSWGRWAGTAEETAYALLLLLEVGAPAPAVRPAARRGYRYLAGMAGSDHPALWHDKDLYRPTAVVNAAVLSALSLARRDPVISRATQWPGDR